ncbi:DEK1, partial [Symbiodinium pilosum]
RPSESSVLEPSRSVEEALGRCEGLQRALGEERMRLLAKLEEATEAAANRARIARAQLEEDGGYAENWVSHGARSQSTFLSAHSREVSDRNKCCIDRGQCVLQ